jgi:hypothetical protein
MIFEFPAENAKIRDCLAGRQSMRTPEPLSQIRTQHYSMRQLTCFTAGVFHVPSPGGRIEGASVFGQ